MAFGIEKYIIFRFRILEIISDYYEEYGLFLLFRIQTKLLFEGLQ